MASAVFDDAYTDGFYLGRGITKTIPDYYRNPRRTPREIMRRQAFERGVVQGQEFEERAA